MIKERFYKLADKMIGKVQNKIKAQGAYENAGQDEIRHFMEMVRNKIDDYQVQCALKDYIIKLVDNLKY